MFLRRVHCISHLIVPLLLALEFYDWLYSFESVERLRQLELLFVVYSSALFLASYSVPGTQQQCFSSWDVPGAVERTHFTRFSNLLVLHWFTACDMKYLFCSTLIAFFVTVRFSWIQPQLEHILLAQHSWTTMRPWDAGQLPCMSIQKKVLRNPSGDNLMRAPNYVNLFLVLFTNTTW